MSDDYSFVVAFVVYLFNMDILYICIFRCTFRLSIDVSVSSFFIVLFPVHVIYFLLLRVVLLRLRVAEEFLFISARRRAYHLYLRLS